MDTHKENGLQERIEELEAKMSSLEAQQRALEVLLAQRDEERKKFEEHIMSYVRELVLPFVYKLKESELTPYQRLNIEVIETMLGTIHSPFLRTMVSDYGKITPHELRIAALVKAGKRRREIAALMHISYPTLESAKTRIKKKMGLTRKPGYLKTHLNNLMQEHSNGVFDA